MVKKLQALRAKKGFTLVELIVVIAIIGVLAAILIPTISGVINDSKMSSVKSTCQSIQTQAKTFAQNYLAKDGKKATGAATEKVTSDGGTVNLAQYINQCVPEILQSTNKAASITITNGEVTTVVYSEGDFVAHWTSTKGMETASANGGKYTVTAVSGDQTLPTEKAISINGTAYTASNIGGSTSTPST